MILPIYNNDSIVYKTNSEVQKANKTRLLRKARKAINESVEAEAKAMEDLLTQIIDLLRLVVSFLTQPQHDKNIVAELHKRRAPAKAPEVWDIFINAVGRGF